MTTTIENSKPGDSPRLNLIAPEDLYLFNEGRHYRSYDKLGAHLMEVGDEPGTCFSVWAPNAREVNLIGSFNQWDESANRLEPRANSGTWEGFAQCSFSNTNSVKGENRIRRLRRLSQLVLTTCRAASLLLQRSDLVQTRTFSAIP